MNIVDHEQSICKSDCISHASGQAVVVSDEYQGITPLAMLIFAAAQPQYAGITPHEVISGQAKPDLWMMHQLIPDMVTICLTLQI